MRGKSKTADRHKGILYIDHPIYPLIHQENETEVKDEKRIKVTFESIKYN